jgi:hypothetical protein
MWLVMNLGTRPFRLSDRGEFTLHFEPILPALFFTKAAATVDFLKNQKRQKINVPADSYAFTMMGKTLVVYHNPLRLNTFGPNKAIVRKIRLQYAGQSKAVEVQGGFLADGQARDVRANKIERIDIELG